MTSERFADDVPNDYQSVGVSPRPWKLIIEDERGEFGAHLNTACTGIRDANGDWVVRFDDDYGTNQWANAEFIVSLVNARADTHSVDVMQLLRDAREAMEGHVGVNHVKGYNRGWFEEVYDRLCLAVDLPDRVSTRLDWTPGRPSHTGHPLLDLAASAERARKARGSATPGPEAVQE